jgi:hypothetical protein
VHESSAIDENSLTSQIIGVVCAEEKRGFHHGFGFLFHAQSEGFSLAKTQGPESLNKILTPHPFSPKEAQKHAKDSSG